MAPTPTAQGNLAKTPLAHVLIYLRDRKLSGSLVLRHEGDMEDLRGENVLTFDAGRLSQIRLPTVQEPLGFVMRSLSMISDDVLNASLGKLAANEGLQGQILIRMGATNAAAVQKAVREQLRRKAHLVFRLREAPYEFYESVDMLQGYGGERFPEELFPILWKGVRLYADPAAVEKVFGNLTGRHIRLKHPNEVNAFGLDRAEQGVIDVLRADAVSADALMRAGLDPRIARTLIYLLVATKQVEAVAPSAQPAAVGGASAGAAAPAQSSASATTSALQSFIGAPLRPPAGTPARGAPAPTSPEPRHTSRPHDGPPRRSSAAMAMVIDESNPRAVEARDKLLAMEQQTYFQMFDLPTSAGADQVRDKFMELAARWHPDRLKPDEKALQSLYSQIFAYLSEAQATLTEDSQRAKYMRTIQEGGGTPAAQKKIVEMIEAATDIQKAEVCFRMRDLPGAERLCRKALAVQPDDPTGITVLASVVLERDPADASGEGQRLLARAIEITPKNDRAHFQLGALHKRRGDLAKAVAHFRSALEANAKNIDAAREMRLAEMRGQDTHRKTRAEREAEAAKASGGFLSKFLKK